MDLPKKGNKKTRQKTNPDGSHCIYKA